jgi:hypothetical protein
MVDSSSPPTIRNLGSTKVAHVRVFRSRPEIWFSALRAEGLKSLAYAESFLINLKSEKKGKI